MAALFLSLENEPFTEPSTPSADSLSTTFSLKKLSQRIFSRPSEDTSKEISPDESTKQRQDPEIAELTLWLQEEAKALDAASQPQATEQRLKERAKNLQNNEVQFLAQVANEIARPANQRILATYLLTLSLENTASGLEVILRAPLQVSAVDAAKTHSPEETLSMQEKALKRMAIDALIEKVKQMPSWRPQAEAIFKTIPDSNLRQYAESRLLEL